MARVSTLSQYLLKLVLLPFLTLNRDRSLTVNSKLGIPRTWRRVYLISPYHPTSLLPYFPIILSPRISFSIIYNKLR